MFLAMAELLIKYRASQDDDLEGKYQFGDVVRPKCSHLKFPVSQLCILNSYRTASLEGTMITYY